MVDIMDGIEKWIWIMVHIIIWIVIIILMDGVIIWIGIKEDIYMDGVWIKIKDGIIIKCKEINLIVIGIENGIWIGWVNHINIMIQVHINMVGNQLIIKIHGLQPNQNGILITIGYQKEHKNFLLKVNH